MQRLGVRPLHVPQSGPDNVTVMSRTFFLYTRTNDLPASRRFYRELVGLDEIWDEADTVAYAVGDTVQLLIAEVPDAPVVSEWAFQPGWVYALDVQPRPPHGSASWSIALSPVDFKAAVARLQQAEVPALRPEPFWAGYWSFVTRDPMGQTVELSDATSRGPAAS
jgi:catechol 2,3-dioxygenase-like lactoylglutathione lyase family enzyme